MPACIKCGHEFRGLGIAGSPFQNTITGQWICHKCYNKLSITDRQKYVLI